MTASRPGLLSAALLLAGAAALAGCSGQPSASGTNAPGSGKSSTTSSTSHGTTAASGDASGAATSQSGPTTDAPDASATDTTAVPGEGGDDWTATTLKDASGTTDVSKIEATLMVKDSDIAWYDGVNRCMAALSLKGDQATISELGCTKMELEGDKDPALVKLSDAMAKIMVEGSPFTLTQAADSVTVTRGDDSITFGH